MLILQKRPDGRYHAIASGTIVYEPKINTKFGNVSFSLGIDNYKDAAGNWVNDNYNCKISNKALMPFASCLEKGDRVLVCGSIFQKSYEKEGVQKMWVEIAVDFIIPQPTIETPTTEEYSEDY